jgi:hypothetical protein
MDGATTNVIWCARRVRGALAPWYARVIVSKCGQVGVRACVRDREHCRYRIDGAHMCVSGVR